MTYKHFKLEPPPPPLPESSPPSSTPLIPPRSKLTLKSTLSMHKRSVSRTFTEKKKNGKYRAHIMSWNQEVYQLETFTNKTYGQEIHWWRNISNVDVISKNIIVFKIYMGHVLIHQHLPSRSISGIGASIIPCVKVKIPVGVQPQAISGIIRSKLCKGLTWYLKTIVKRIEKWKWK